MPTIDPAAILVPPRQRSRMNDAKFAEIRESIREKGQIQPIIVRKAPEGLTLVVGGRRLAACLALGREVWYELFESLSEDDATEVELEENLKREDLPWRDQVTAIGTIHALHLARDPAWSGSKTARRLSIDVSWVVAILTVHKNLASPLLESVTGIDHAYSILQRASERRAASIVNEIATSSAKIFASGTSGAGLDVMHPNPADASSPMVGEGGTSGGVPSVGGVGGGPTNVTSAVTPPPPPSPILLADFLLWAPTYGGPKFNLLHCDFPYGIKYEDFAHSVREPAYASTEDIYGQLIKALISNLDRILSYSAHVVFWFSMDTYDATRRALSAGGLTVQAHPLFWHKTDHAGIVPGRGGQYPRRVYETAFLCSRGQRPLIRASDNAYGCPTAANALHPSQKPEPMLRHFLGMLTDATTDFLDPTCGSGSAVRAAEDCGARNAFGLEVNPDYHAAALAATVRARVMRIAAQ